MITIHLNQFWAEDTEKATECVNFINGLLDSSSKDITIYEEEGNPESGFEKLMVFPDIKMVDISVWDELMELGNDQEIYVLVYDHDSRIRKGYWYDEENEWNERDMTGDDFYSKYLG